MDNKNRKIYNKALFFHGKGEINKALDLCENVLAENLGESEILNFKGLMLYERGLLKEAVTVWKINVDLNNDSMAKSYIKDAKYDEERIEIYKSAEKALKKSDIDNAIKLFLQCAKSDFNCIKVNTGIAWCYQKKGDYYRAKEYVDKALKIDKHAVTANEIKKQLDNMDLYYAQNKQHAGIGKIIVTFALIIVLFVGGYFVWKNYIKVMNNTDNELAYSIESKEEDNIVDSKENINGKNNLGEQIENNTNKLEYESLNTAINDSDYNLIYEKINGIQANQLNDDEKKIYDKAVSILKEAGVSSFYEYGLWYFNQKDFPNAKNQLDKAYEYCEGNNLEQHIIFYRGSTASEQGDKDLALEMYKKYEELYPKGSYIEGVLYELALLLEDNNKEEARLYAERLISNYPKSIYINDRIMNIVNTAN